MAHLFLQCASPDEWHDRVRRPFLFSIIQDLKNIRVVQLSQRFGFALKAFEKFVLLGPLLLVDPDDLDGHIAFQIGIEGLIDRGHATLSKLLDDMVPPQVLPDQVIQCDSLLRCGLFSSGRIVSSIVQQRKFPILSKEHRSRIEFHFT